jgi:hypothetical protein
MAVDSGKRDWYHGVYEPVGAVLFGALGGIIGAVMPHD